LVATSNLVLKTHYSSIIAIGIVCL